MKIKGTRWVDIVLTVLLTTLLLGSVAMAADAEIEDMQGALIVAVLSDSPAADAGIVRGDIVLAMDDEFIAGSADFAARVQGAEPGDVVVLTVLHGDDEYTVDVELGDQDGSVYLGVFLARDIEEPPVREPAQSEPEAIEPGTTDPDASEPETSIPVAPKAYGMQPYTDTAAGAMIIAIAEGSPAAEAGIGIGDVILGIDGERFTMMDDLADRVDAYDPGDEVMLEILRRNGELEEVPLVLGQHPEDAERAFVGIQYMPTPRRMFLGYSEDGDLLVPRGRMYPHYWRHDGVPRSHRWLPFGHPMPDDWGGDCEGEDGYAMPWRGCDEEEGDGEEGSEESSEHNEDDGSLDSDDSDNAALPLGPESPIAVWQRL